MSEVETLIGGKSTPNFIRRTGGAKIITARPYQELVLAAVHVIDESKLLIDQMLLIQIGVLNVFSDYDEPSVDKRYVHVIPVTRPFKSTV